MEWTFENIIYIIAGVTFCIFAIKLLCALIGFDFEADVDFDFGDIISFKGIVHFLMGFSGYLSIMFHNGTYNGTKDIAYAGIIGLIVMILLYFTYILIYKLDSPHKTKTGRQLVGYKATINFIKDKDKHLYLIDVVVDMNSITVSAKSDRSYKVGDEVIISQFKDNLYLI
jgi:hypothetical protein